MIKIKKELFKNWFWIISWIVILAIAYLNIIELERYKKVVNVELIVPLAFKEGKDVLSKANADEKNISFVLWKEQEGMIQEKNLGRSRDVNIINVHGRTDILFFDSYIFDEADKDGCLIDKQTAHQLFGDTSVTGKNIIYQNKEYIIRNILNSEKGIFVVQADKNISFDMVTVSNSSEVTATSIASQLSSKYNLIGTVIDLNILIYFSHILLVWIPYISVCIWILKILWTYKNIYDKSVLCYVLFSLAFWIVLPLAIIILFKYGNFPDYLIPPKWSDYYFWKDTKSKLVIILENLFEIERRKPIKPFYISFYKNIFFSIISLGMLFKIRGILKSIITKPKGFRMEG